MVPRAIRLAKGATLIAAVLLTASAARAQTSAQDHVPARNISVPLSFQGLPPFGIYPGDRMFQATMKVESSYHLAERAVPMVMSRPLSWRSTVRIEEAPVEVTVTEPARPMESVSIRGPNGEVRSFPIVGGRQAIKARTVIVRPGQKLNLVIYGGQTTLTRR